MSYKYLDTSVYQDISLDKISIPGLFPREVVTPRSYLNYIESILEDTAIAKWESGDNDLSQFKDSTIESKLRDLIYDSSITIVLISPQMNDQTKFESDQWIPWEISYSLKEDTRNGRTSKSNGIIAVVLPDGTNNYDYCLEYSSACNSTTLKFSNSFCFKIIGKNFFNSKKLNAYHCPVCNGTHYSGTENHYFVYAKWCDFIKNPKIYIELASKHSETIDDYNITKEV